MLLPNVSVGKRLQVGLGKPRPLGIGRQEIRGSAYIQGPMIFGSATYWQGVGACVMLAPLTNPESPKPNIGGSISACGSFNSSPYTLGVYGPTAMFDELDVNDKIIASDNIQSGADIIAQGEVKSQCGKHVLSRKKNFDIPHPTKDGWRLTHTCVEGPEAAVYVRGRVRNKTEIVLPEYWTGFVDEQSITVSLTPVGSHQNVIVKRIGENTIYLQSNGGMPIDCFYHVFAERIDTEKLIPEYKGTIEDYPGDNSQRSIAGYHYDVKN